MCVFVCACVNVYMPILWSTCGGHRTALGILVSSLPCGSQAFNLGHRTWWIAPSPRQPYHYPSILKQGSIWSNNFYLPLDQSTAALSAGAPDRACLARSLCRKIGSHRCVHLDGGRWSADNVREATGGNYETALALSHFSSNVQETVFLFRISPSQSAEQIVSAHLS